MRFVKKKDIPEFFTLDTKDFKVWSDYNDFEETKQKRRNLKKYILENEQNFLCIYCECKVDLDSSHIEHIKPKEIYLDLIFTYTNLVVSCHGQCLKIPSQDKFIHRCGHKKGSKFDENSFLNPTELEDIREYFSYDLDSFTINPTSKDEAKSKYTIDLLQLNEGNISLRREKTLKSFNNIMNKIKDIDKRKNAMREIIYNSSVPFVSLLAYKYSRYL